jgi:glycolate oxidase iron-sulfur subunit
MEGRAFDPRRPPEQSVIDDCVHCGLCLPTCPTYLLWNEEMDSPRGRIVLMKAGLEEGSEFSQEMVEHFDRCLGCMACVTACPSGVAYDRLIEATRPQIERNFSRPSTERLFRRLLFEVFTHPGRLRVLAPLLAASQATGLQALVRRRGLLDRFPRLAALDRLTPQVPLRPPRRLAELTPARGRRRARVGLLRGCVQRVLFSQVNQATVRVLAAEGFEVFAPRVPRCCGALMLHSGYEPAALELARETMTAFEDCDVIAVNAAGCGSSMKEYGRLLEDADPPTAERARRFSEKVKDVSELLAGLEPRAPRHPVPLKVAYHDACHLAHAQGIRAEPRALLAAIPELELVEPAEWEICCGSAGIYNLLQPEAADELGIRKARNLMATGAAAIAAANPGCGLQIAAYLRAAGHPLPVYHPIELVAASLDGDRLAE